MGEKRAGDLKVGDSFREFGDLDDGCHKITYREDRGDSVIVAVETDNGESDWDYPPLDRDTVVEVEETYLVSFGGMYRTEPHPVLGWWPELGQDAVLEVHATGRAEAREKVHSLIGKEWCAVYGPTDPPGWDALNLGSLAAAVQDPKPTSWTVGCQVTLNADGTVELHMEDVEDDLTEEGAPRSLVADLGERLQFFSPQIQWVSR